MVETSEIARRIPAILGEGGGRGLVVLVIAIEDTGSGDLDLAVRSDADRETGNAMPTEPSWKGDPNGLKAQGAVVSVRP